MLSDTRRNRKNAAAGDTGTDAGEANTGAWSGTSKGEKGEIQSGEGTLISCGACGNRDRRNDPWNYSRYDIRVRRTEDEKKKSGKRIFAIVLLVVIGIGGFYFGYDIGRMDHDEERIRAELKKDDC